MMTFVWELVEPFLSRRSTEKFTIKRLTFSWLVMDEYMLVLRAVSQSAAFLLAPGSLVKL